MALAVAMAMTMLFGLAPTGAQAAAPSLWPSPAMLNGYFFWLGKDAHTGAWYDAGANNTNGLSTTGTGSIDLAESYLLGELGTPYATVTQEVYDNLWTNWPAVLTKAVPKVASTLGITQAAAGLRVAQFYQDVAILGFATSSTQLGHDETFMDTPDPNSLLSDTYQLEDTQTLQAVTETYGNSNAPTIYDYYQYLLDIEGIGIPECHYNVATGLTSVFASGSGAFQTAEQWLENGMDWIGGRTPASVTPMNPASNSASIVDSVDGSTDQGQKDQLLFQELSRTWLVPDMGHAQYYADEVGDSAAYNSAFTTYSYGTDAAEIAVMKTFIRSRTHFSGYTGTPATPQNPFEESLALSTTSTPVAGAVYVEFVAGSNISACDLTPSNNPAVNDAGSTNTGVVTADVTTNAPEMTVTPAGAGAAEITAYTANSSKYPDSWIYKAWITVSSNPGPGPGPSPVPPLAAVTPVGTPPAGAMVWPYTLIKFGEESFDFVKGNEYQFKATGGTAPYTWTFVPGVATKPGLFTWSAVPGAMPDGVSLSSSGVLTGTPKTLKSIGYWLLSLKVTDSAGNSNTMLAKVFLAAFPDIIDNWAVNDIDQITVYGVCNGYPDHMFWPNKNITRGEFAKWLVLSQGYKPLYDYSDLTQFVDYNSLPSWDKPYLASAVAHNLMVGYSKYGNGTGPSILAPNQYITREEMAAMIGRSFTGVTPANLDQFPDGNQVHNWAHNFRMDVAIAVAAGIIKGYPDSHLSPLQDTLRDQAAAMIARWMKIADPNE